MLTVLVLQGRVSRKTIGWNEANATYMRINICWAIILLTVSYYNFIESTLLACIRELIVVNSRSMLIAERKWRWWSSLGRGLYARCEDVFKNTCPHVCRSFGSRPARAWCRFLNSEVLFEALPKWTTSAAGNLGSRNCSMKMSVGTVVAGTCACRETE